MSSDQPSDKPADKQPSKRDKDGDEVRSSPQPACPVCGGHLVEIRGKLVCSRCHTICETCCEGGIS